MDGVFRVACVPVHLSLCRVDPRCGLLARVATGGSKYDVVQV